MILGGLYMLLNILMYIHKRKLNRLIEKDADYNSILKESIILDEYILRKFKECNRINP